MELATTMQPGCIPQKKSTGVKTPGNGLVSGLGHFGRAVGKASVAKAPAHTNGNGNGHAPGNGHAHVNGNGNGLAAHGAATRPGDVARELISALWERSVPLLTDRLNGLDIACEAAVVGRLSPIMRRGAADTAHKLAGSLGMFGYPRGTDLAREIEQLLENDGAVDAGLLRELVLELRACLPL